MKKKWLTYFVGGVVIFFLAYSELPAVLPIRSLLLLLIFMLWFVMWSVLFWMESTKEVAIEKNWKKAFVSVRKAVPDTQIEAFNIQACALVVVQPKLPRLSLFARGDVPPRSLEHVILTLTPNLYMPDIGIMLDRCPIYRTWDISNDVFTSPGDCIVVWYRHDYKCDPIFGLKPDYLNDFLAVAIKHSTL